MNVHIRQYFLLLKWQLMRLRTILPFFVFIQIVIGLGAVLGLGFLVPEMDAMTAIFLVTGGPTLTLITVGLVMVPQLITEDKSKGSLTYIWALPISRITYLLADLTMWTFATLPGMVLALLVGSWHYGFTLSVSPVIIPAFLIVSATASCMGYAIAHCISKEQITLMLTNLIVFGLFLFSPINYPLERLPAFLQTLHSILPVMYMADLIRGSLAGHYAFDIAVSFIIVSVWMLLSFALVAIVLQRRK